MPAQVHNRQHDDELNKRKGNRREFRRQKSRQRQADHVSHGNVKKDESQRDHRRQRSELRGKRSGRKFIFLLPFFNQIFTFGEFRAEINLLNARDHRINTRFFADTFFEGDLGAIRGQAHTHPLNLCHLGDHALNSGRARCAVHAGDGEFEFDLRHIFSNSVILTLYPIVTIGCKIL